MSPQSPSAVRIHLKSFPTTTLLPRSNHPWGCAWVAAISRKCGPVIGSFAVVSTDTDQSLVKRMLCVGCLTSKHRSNASRLIEHKRVHRIEHDATNPGSRVLCMGEQSIKDREQERLGLSRPSPRGDGDGGLMTGGRLIYSFKHLDLVLIEFSNLRKHLRALTDLLQGCGAQESLGLHRHKRCAASSFGWKCWLKPQIRNKSPLRTTPQPTTRISNAIRLRWRSVFDGKVNHRMVKCLHGSSRVKKCHYRPSRKYEVAKSATRPDFRSTSQSASM